MEFAATVVILTCTYALLAAGVVILYKAARVVNFAHGELAIVGAYVFYSAGLITQGQSLLLTIAATAAISALFGVAIYVALMRRLVGHWNGEERVAHRFIVVPYNIPETNCATYFPEANVLVPIGSVAEKSNTPTSKSVAITVRRAEG